jgi:hypothetical protein
MLTMLEDAKYMKPGGADGLRVNTKAVDFNGKELGDGRFTTRQVVNCS